MGEEKPAKWYNESNMARVLKPLEESNWLFLYKAIYKFMPEDKNINIIDLGCGTGRLARLLANKGYKNYIGLDFASDHLEEAKKYVPEFKFYLGDVFDQKHIFYQFDVFIISEVLEHLEEDLKLIGSIPLAKCVIFSVPNFNSAAHVRWFNNISEVIHRYKHLLEIEESKTLSGKKENKIFLVKAKRI